MIKGTNNEGDSSKVFSGQDVPDDLDQLVSKVHELKKKSDFKPAFLESSSSFFEKSFKNLAAKVPVFAKVFHKNTNKVMPDSPTRELSPCESFTMSEEVDKLEQWLQENDEKLLECLDRIQELELKMKKDSAEDSSQWEGKLNQLKESFLQKSLSFLDEAFEIFEGENEIPLNHREFKNVFSEKMQLVKGLKNSLIKMKDVLAEEKEIQKWEQKLVEYTENYLQGIFNGLEGVIAESHVDDMENLEKCLRSIRLFGAGVLEQANSGERFEKNSWLEGRLGELQASINELRVDFLDGILASVEKSVEKIKGSIQKNSDNYEKVMRNLAKIPDLERQLVHFEHRLEEFKEKRVDGSYLIKNKQECEAKLYDLKFECCNQVLQILEEGLDDLQEQIENIPDRSAPNFYQALVDNINYFHRIEECYSCFSDVFKQNINENSPRMSEDLTKRKIWCQNQLSFLRSLCIGQDPASFILNKSLEKVDSLSVLDSPKDGVSPSLEKWIALYEICDAIHYEEDKFDKATPKEGQLQLALQNGYRNLENNKQELNRLKVEFMNSEIEEKEEIQSLIQEQNEIIKNLENKIQGIHKKINEEKVNKISVLARDFVNYLDKMPDREITALHMKITELDQIILPPGLFAERLDMIMLSLREYRDKHDPTNLRRLVEYTKEIRELAKIMALDEIQEFLSK